MNRNDFILPVSIIKIQEKKLLSEYKLIKMLETNTSKEIIKILSETDYNYSMVGVTSDEMYEEILFNEVNRIYKFTRELAKKEEKIVDILALKYEYQNLKIKLKNKYSNSNLEKFLIDTKIKDKDKLNHNFDIVSNEKDIVNASIILDKLYLKHVMDIANDLKFDIFIKYSNILIDSYNVNSFLRLKRQNKNIDFVDEVLLEGGSITKNELLKSYQINDYINLFKKKFDNKVFENFEKKNDISEVEKMFDNMIIELAIEYRNVNIGPEPIFTYIIAKEYEIKALRLIISGKLNSIDIDLIKSRMRGIYV